jgi:hypothetical protein
MLKLHSDELKGERYRSMERKNNNNNTEEETVQKQ